MDKFQINLDDVKVSLRKVGGLTTAKNEILDISGRNGSPSLNMTHFMLAMQRETKFLEKMAATLQN